MKTYLITGCAGFIGSNFVHYMLKKYPEILLVNLDKLTYAGNLENLKDVEGDPRHVFVQGDICDKELVEYTRATHEELSNMSSGLAEYTKAMSRTINTMNRELCVIAKHYHAEEEARDNNTASAQAAADTNDIEEI